MVLKPGYGKLWRVSVAQNFDRIHWIFFYYIPFKVRNNHLFNNFFYTLYTVFASTTFRMVFPESLIPLCS